VNAHMIGVSRQYSLGESLHKAAQVAEAASVKRWPRVRTAMGSAHCSGRSGCRRRVQRCLSAPASPAGSPVPIWSMVISLAAVLISACDSRPTGLSEADEPNVTVLAGGDVATTDTAVLVNGQTHIDFGDGPMGIFVQHHTEYTYGGLHGHLNEDLREESWYMDVSRRIVTRESGDTTFYRSLDFGDVALEGTPASFLEVDTATAINTGHDVRVYENHLLHRVLIYSHRLNMDGSTVTFAHEPYYEHMVAGGGIELTASGSDDIAPTSTTLTFRAGARVTGLSNGDEFAFEQERPVLRPDEPLVVELSRPLAPDRTVLYLFYAPAPQTVDPAVARRASAVFVLTETTDRVVIPASALTEMASHLPEAEGEYVFRIVEYIVKEDVLDIVRIDGDVAESLTGIQGNIFGFYLLMRR